MSLLIFPNQLFPLKMINLIDSLKFNKIFIIEEPRYFSDFKFHKLKLVYHRASMKKYYDELTHLSSTILVRGKETIRIDAEHTYMIGKYGPVIKCVKDKKTTFKAKFFPNL